MKARITLELDEGLVREIQTIADEEKISINTWLAASLEQIVRERRTYERARKRALARLREGLDLRWAPPRSRGQLHQR